MTHDKMSVMVGTFFDYAEQLDKPVPPQAMSLIFRRE